MNNLKFRFFELRFDNPRMCYSEEWNGIVDKNDRLSKFFSYASRYSKDGIIQQFTGLKDKNGREIYEGDIISIHTKDLKRYQNAEIFWSDVNYCYLAKVYFGKDFISYRFAELTINNVEIEIVGNIYQNPELLKS